MVSILGIMIGVAIVFAMWGLLSEKVDTMALLALLIVALGVLFVAIDGILVITGKKSTNSLAIMVLKTLLPFMLPLVAIITGGIIRMIWITRRS